MGMTEGEYWRCTPLNFYRRQIARERNHRRDNVLIRELLTAYLNVHREKDTPAIASKDAYPLYGDKVNPPAAPRTRTREEQEELNRRYNS